MTVRPQDLASTLLRRKRLEHEGFARRARELRQRLELAVRDAGARGELSRAWLIGSMAWGPYG